MDLQLKGKTALVTGGGSNIGRAISLTLAREGANVVIADLDDVQGNKTAGLAAEASVKAACVPTDVTKLESVRKMLDTAIAQFGQIHILVNNVGWSMSQLFLETEPAFWDKVIALNYRHQLNMLRTVLPHMIERDYGRVVNIGSDASRIGELRQAVYSGCKAGVIALTKAVAREVGRHNITLNVVSPGLTLPNDPEEVGVLSWTYGDSLSGAEYRASAAKAAKACALRRLGTSQDIANAVAFLVSDAAGYVTGQVLSVSGGYSMAG